ncbi:hypothetical protein [Nocardia sp. NPDC003979]
MPIIEERRQTGARHRTEGSHGAPVLAARAPASVREREIVMPFEDVVLEGCLQLPARPIGLVVLAHGGGEGRHGRRNRFVADLLAGHRLATLTMDLQTAAEDQATMFDVELLGDRLARVRRRLRVVPELQRLPVGYFGIGPHAPAALWAATEPDALVGAVVVRGGRPDLAGDRLGLITAPTLFLVGGLDERVRERNYRAAGAMIGERRVTELTAPNLPRRAGYLSWRAAYLAAVWFTEHLTVDAAADAAPAAARSM